MMFGIIVKPQVTKFIERNNLFNPPYRYEYYQCCRYWHTFWFRKRPQHKFSFMWAINCASFDRHLYKMKFYSGFKGYAPFFYVRIWMEEHNVQLINEQSKVKSIKIEVPQRSVLGPVSVCIYIRICTIIFCLRNVFCKLMIPFDNWTKKFLWNKPEHRYTWIKG